MTNNNCTNCGEPIAEGRKICTSCGKPFECGAEEPCCTEKDECKSNQNQNGSGNVIYVKEKSTAVSILLSFLFTGAGQVYNGQLKKGILMQIGFWVGMIFMFIPTFIVWIYSMYDAYTQADKMNKGEIPFVEATAKDAVLYIVAYMVIGFIAAFVFVILWGFLLMLPFMLFGF